MAGEEQQQPSDGPGELTYQRAIDIARNTEGSLNTTVRQYLERALSDIWGRVQQAPSTYVLTRDEFVVFNYYIGRFEGNVYAQEAVARYWQYAAQPGGTHN